MTSAWPGCEQADDAVNLRGLERFLERERRKDGGQPFGEHRFAGAGRADEQHVVTTGRGDFQRALDGLLAFDIGEVHLVVVVADRRLLAMSTLVGAILISPSKKAAASRRL